MRADDCPGTSATVNGDKKAGRNARLCENNETGSYFFFLAATFFFAAGFFLATGFLTAFLAAGFLVVAFLAVAIFILHIKY